MTVTLPEIGSRNWGSVLNAALQALDSRYIDPTLVDQVLQAAEDAVAAAGVIASGAGIDPTGAAGSRNALQAKIDAVSEAGGGEVAVPSGSVLKLEAPLYARSNVCLRLQEGAHLLRGYAGGLPLIRNESLTPAGKISNFSILGPGKIGAANTTDGGQIIYLYGDDLTLADFTVDTFGDGDGGATPLGSQAILIGGDRNLVAGVKTANSADIGGTGGIRMFGGKHFRGIGCHIVSGDDCLQFVPIASGELGSLDIEDAAYIGCTGASTEARFMCVTNDNGGAGGMTSNIRNVSFVGCHGSGQRRGILIGNTDSTGVIENVGFVDCSVDMAGGTAVGQEIRIERGASAGAVRNIRLNVRVSNPTTTVFQSASSTVGAYIESVSLIDCVFGGPADGAATIAPNAVDGFTIRGGRITAGTGGSGDHVIKGGTGTNNSKRVSIHGASIVGVRDGFAGVRLPETLGFRVRDTTVTPAAAGTTGQAVSLVNASTGGIIDGNDFSAIPGTKIAGTIATGTIIKDNDGLVTKAKGQDTVAAAATSKNVTHGLGRVPTTKDILLTPANAEAAAASYYVSNANASIFTITTAAAPGGAGALFNWSADVSTV